MPQYKNIALAVLSYIKTMKDYTDWHKEKTKIENTERNIPNFVEGQIWWCSIGSNIGQEQDGKNDSFERPVLILKKFNKKIAWVLPISTKIKVGPHYYTSNHDGNSFSIIVSQLRLISAKRLRRFMWNVTQEELFRVRKRITEIIL